MQHIAAIDGLRAIAVGAVVLYHLGAGWLPGGFAGVDVFFVISGFLITRIILSEASEGRFSYVRFYDRRIKRIIPALFVLLAVVSLVAVFVLLPKDLAEFGASLFGAALSVSNFIFFLQSDYFSTLSEFRPLLHTWSLGVEEQFYIVMPIFLAVAIRLGLSRRAIVGLLAAMFALSLVLTQMLLVDYPTATFYLLPFRMWELLAGSVLAAHDLWKQRAISSKLAYAAGFVGLGLIIAGFLLIGQDTPFPGIAAAPAVVGAALVILAALPAQDAPRRSPVLRLLSLPPMRFLGRISYSLYLWHWPPIVFWRHLFGPEISLPTAVLLGLLGLVLAWISYRFVELPARHGNFSLLRYRHAAAFGAATLACTVLGTGLYLAKGLPQRLSADTLAILSALGDVNPERARCHDEGATGAFLLADVCRFGSGARQVAVWGDSHGAELAWALGTEPSVTLAQITSSRCPPLMDVTIPARPHCPTRNREVLAELTASNIEVVVLAAFWESHLLAGRIDHLSAAVTALTAAGKTVVIVGLIPTPNDTVPQRLAQMRRQGALPAQVTFAPKAEIQNKADAALRMIATYAGVQLVLPSEVMCSNGACPIYANGIVYYFDTNHLTITGIRPVVAQIMRAIAP